MSASYPRNLLFVPAVTHNEAGLFDIAGKLGVFTKETVSRVDEVDVVCLCDLDDLVASQVGSDRRVLSTLSNDIGFVGLLPVHGQTVLVTEDCHGLEGELVGGTEDSNGNFSAVCN